MCVRRHAGKRHGSDHGMRERNEGGCECDLARSSPLVGLSESPTRAALLFSALKMNAVVLSCLFFSYVVIVFRTMETRRCHSPVAVS